MIKVLAEDLAWHFDTDEELDAVILSFIGHFFTPARVDLNNAAARAIWLKAPHDAWCLILQKNPPTQEEFCSADAW